MNPNCLLGKPENLARVLNRIEALPGARLYPENGQWAYNHISTTPRLLFCGKVYCKAKDAYTAGGALKVPRESTYGGVKRVIVEFAEASNWV
jgi:hypothetical protein